MKELPPPRVQLAVCHDLSCFLHDGEDITSLLLESTLEGGEKMSDVDFGSFFVQLVTAGNDTTKTMMSTGVLVAAWYCAIRGLKIS